MLDSRGKFLPGLLRKDFIDYGSYDQCMSIEAVQFFGKFALFRLHKPLPPKSEDHRLESLASFNGSWLEIYKEFYEMDYLQAWTLGACFPSSCDANEIEAEMNHFLRLHKIPLKAEYVLHSQSSRAIKEEEFLNLPAYKKMCTAILASLVLVTITATLLRAARPEKNWGSWKAFDMIENTRKVFEHRRKKEEEVQERSLRLLSGIRVGYFAATALLHVIFNSGLSSPLTHMNYIPFIWSVNIFLRLFATMGTNFLCLNFIMGGLLCYYSWHQVMVKRGGRISLMQFAMGRFLRTTPTIIGTLVIVLSFPTSWGNGPVFMYGVRNVTENCLKNFWAELSYTSNQIDGPFIVSSSWLTKMFISSNVIIFIFFRQCLPHGWYMGADFQLYILSFALLSTLHNKPRLGQFVVLVIVLVGVLLQFLNVYLNDLPAHLSFLTKDYHKAAQDLRQFHFATHNYLSSFAIGILLGRAISVDYIIKSKVGIKKVLGISFTANQVILLISKARN